MARKFEDFRPGAMPDDAVYRTLGIELEPGDVRFTVPAQRHAYKGHKDDFDKIMPHIVRAVTAPSFMGDDARNPDKIEFVSRIPGENGGALVAITVDRDEKDGCYHVCSMYLISQSKLDKKRDKGILKQVKPKRS